MLDTALGSPAAGIDVQLEVESSPDSWATVGTGTTDADGRVTTLLDAGASLEAGTYRLCFATGQYLDRTAGGGFYPRARIEFIVGEADTHYHVPLLLSPWGYSTYRGS